MSISFEIHVRASLDTLWFHTESPERPERWNRRFSRIEYVRGSEAIDGVRVLYRGEGPVRRFGWLIPDLSGRAAPRRSRARYTHSSDGVLKVTGVGVDSAAEDFMQRIAVAVAAISFVLGSLVTRVVGAQAPTPSPMKLFTSAPDVTAMIAKAKAERKPDQPNFVQPLLTLAPYGANLEYRVAGVNAPASVHEKDAELFYVIDGTGTLVTGGKLKDERRTNADNLSGTGVDGGTPRRVAKGDFVMVPENTPHWFTGIDGTLVLMSLHVPHSAR